MRQPGIKEFSRITPSVGRADDWLKDAFRHLALARAALPDDYSESVAHSSKAVEFSAKSLMTLAGVLFPREHVVGIGMEWVWQSLTGKDAESVALAKRHIARVGWVCDVVAPLQTVSEYGFAGKSTTLLVNKKDADIYLEYGAEATDIAGRVLAQVQKGAFKFSPKPGREG